MYSLCYKLLEDAMDVQIVRQHLLPSRLTISGSYYSLYLGFTESIYRIYGTSPNTTPDQTNLSFTYYAMVY